MNATELKFEWGVIVLRTNQETVMEHPIITLGGFVFILAALGIAAARLGVDSRQRDDRSNW